MSMLRLHAPVSNDAVERAQGELTGSRARVDGAVGSARQCPSGCSVAGPPQGGAKASGREGALGDRELGGVKAGGGERGDVLEPETEGLAPESASCADKGIGKPNRGERRAALRGVGVCAPKPLEVGDEHVPPERGLIREQCERFRKRALAGTGALRALRARRSTARRDREDEACQARGSGHPGSQADPGRRANTPQGMDRGHGSFDAVAASNASARRKRAGRGAVDMGVAMCH
jgi:hypothetical protein